MEESILVGMNKKIFERYFKAVYGIVLFLAVILFLLALLWRINDIWQSTLLNLSTELLGVVLVFFLVQYLFKIDELETGERIDKLLETLEERDTVKAGDFFHTQPHMDELIERSKETKIAGVTLTVCIDKGMGAFRTSLQNGAIIKLILIDGSEESFHACSVRSDTNSISYFRKKHATTMDNIDYLIKYSNRPEIKGRVLVRRIPYPPTTGIEIFKDDEKSLIKVEIYPQHTGWDRPPIFMIDSKKDENWFAYFENQFDAIWNRGTDYIVNAQNIG